jgi:hypothetical protein
MKRALATVAALCALAGVVVAALAMWIAWDHNPQREFHELAADGTQLIHWGWWATVGLSWFLVIYVPLFVISGSATVLSLHRRDRRSAG